MLRLLIRCLWLCRPDGPKRMLLLLLLSAPNQLYRVPLTDGQQYGWFVTKTEGPEPWTQIKRFPRQNSEMTKYIMYFKNVEINYWFVFYLGRWCLVRLCRVSLQIMSNPWCRRTPTSVCFKSWTVRAWPTVPTAYQMGLSLKTFLEWLTCTRYLRVQFGLVFSLHRLRSFGGPA